jgi:hypothetical protein
MCEVNLDKETLFLDNEIIELLTSSDHKIASEYPIDFLFGMTWSILTSEQRHHLHESVKAFLAKSKEQNENPIPSDRSE